MAETSPGIQTHNCYSRILPLKNVATEEEVKQINDLCFRVSEITRHTYQFIKLFLIYRLENGLSYPKISDSTIKVAMSLVSARKRARTSKSPYLKCMQDFYEQHYKPIQVQEKEDGTCMNDMLKVVCIQIITNVENHVKGHFYNYIKKLAKVHLYNEEKDYSNKLTVLIKDLYYGTFDSDSMYHALIKQFSPDIQAAKRIYSRKPQECLKVLYDINLEIEKQAKLLHEQKETIKPSNIIPDQKETIKPSTVPNQKLKKRVIPKPFCFLPLKRSLIPDSIQISETISDTSFGGTDFWDSLKARLEYEFKNNIKPYHEITSVQTDGISLSVRFQRGEHKWGTKKVKQTNPEHYMQDLTRRKIREVRDLHAVGIDPNKGNLAYCNDGESKLRYTQNQRQVESGRRKYRKIRLLKEKDCRSKMDPEDDWDLRGNLMLLALYSGNSMTYDSFQDYVFQKNQYAQRFLDQYRQPFYRKFRFNAKINVKRSEACFLNKFEKVFGPPSDVIIGYGDWEQRQGISFGKEPTLGKGMRTIFRKRGYKVFLINERATSKTCCICYADNEYNFLKRKDPRPWMEEKEQDVWGLSRCTNGNCRAIHNRDHCSSSNILSITKHYMDPVRNNIPDPFIHP